MTMAKQRVVHTNFWTDGFIRKINPLDRYLFLYFLTNDHSNFCGTYEISIDVVSFETGLTITDLQTSFLPRLEPKVIYRDGWVHIPKFEKFHAQGGPNITIAVEKAKAAVPSHILEIFNSIEGGSKGVLPLPLPLPLPLFKKRAKPLKKDPLVAEKPFVSSEEVAKLVTSDRVDMKILGLYFRKKGYDFRNKEQLGIAVRREIKFASDLKHFDADQLREAFDKTQKHAAEMKYDWKLSTVLKFIN